jgi:hypothetical protein
MAKTTDDAGTSYIGAGAEETPVAETPTMRFDKSDDNTIFVGRKPSMAYVLGVITQFNEGKGQSDFTGGRCRGDCQEKVPQRRDGEEHRHRDRGTRIGRQDQDKRFVNRDRAREINRKQIENGNFTFPIFSYFSITRIRDVYRSKMKVLLCTGCSRTWCIIMSLRSPM